MTKRHVLYNLDEIGPYQRPFEQYFAFALDLVHISIIDLQS